MTRSDNFTLAFRLARVAVVGTVAVLLAACSSAAHTQTPEDVVRAYVADAEVAVAVYWDDYLKFLEEHRGGVEPSVFSEVTTDLADVLERYCVKGRPVPEVYAQLQGELALFVQYIFRRLIPEEDGALEITRIREGAGGTEVEIRFGEEDAPLSSRYFDVWLTKTDDGWMFAEVPRRLEEIDWDEVMPDER